ncbi:MAG: DUF4139 domain-containing protein [bacterium]|nr:DUF4139 domain-containing protein [bacterium]
MRIFSVSIAFAAFIVAAGTAGGQSPKLSDPLQGKVHQARTGLAEQTDVAVTVYNTDLALVRDRRKLTLMPGEQSLTFMDVAQQVRPQTVSLRSVSAPGSIRIVEQNYEFDLMSPAKLMEKYVGKDVRLVNFSTDIGFTEREAKLLSVNEGPIYQVDDAIFLGHPGNVVLPEIPENLIAKPSLVWIIDNTKTEQEIEVTYLTGGIRWTADYVLTLARDDRTMDLAGWVTLTNQSGTQYTNAQLKLVAGDVNVVRPDMRRAMRAKGGAMMAEAPAMAEESFAEYHLYTLPRRTTIKENQSKQVSLLTASGVGVEKLYEFRGNPSFFMDRMPPVKDQKVGVFLKFRNEEANHLGIPLPAGVMRVYQEDSTGMLQFAGEDRVQHTPKDEDVRLRLGNAFDIVGERIQKDYQRLGDRTTESTYEIKVRNHKDVSVKVDIVEPMPGDWQIRDASQNHVKKDARTAVFTVDVPKDGEAVVEYTVRVKF